jgi:hypothetical protein
MCDSCWCNCKEHTDIRTTSDRSTKVQQATVTVVAVTYRIESFHSISIKAEQRAYFLTTAHLQRNEIVAYVSSTACNVQA